jgi:hypothetical protein
MGEAKARGTAEERREQSINRELDTAECVIFLKATDGKLNIGFLPRDEEPNQDSPAMIFAAYVNANFTQLAGEAMAMYESATQGLPGDGSVMLAEAPKRSIVDAVGNIASDAPALVGPDGGPLQ